MGDRDNLKTSFFQLKKLTNKLLRQKSYIYLFNSTAFLVAKNHLFLAIGYRGKTFFFYCIGHVKQIFYYSLSLTLRPRDREEGKIGWNGPITSFFRTKQQ